MEHLFHLYWCYKLHFKWKTCRSNDFALPLPDKTLHELILPPFFITKYQWHLISIKPHEQHLAIGESLFVACHCFPICHCKVFVSCFLVLPYLAFKLQSSMKHCNTSIAILPSWFLFTLLYSYYFFVSFTKMLISMHKFIERIRNLEDYITLAQKQ